MPRQVRLLDGSLGIIPDWQFSPDPKVNPNINPYVNIPAGWMSQSLPAQNGFLAPRAPEAGAQFMPANDAQKAALGYQMVEQLGAIPNPFESWWWVNRKPLVIGGVVLLGLGAIALVATVVK